VDPETLWQAADKLRGSIDAAEYKHVVLGLIFLKYISDAFDARRATLSEELKSEGIEGTEAEALLESRDEYTAENVFGFLMRLGGPTSRHGGSSPTSPGSSMMQCMRSSATTPSSRASCRAIMPDAALTLRG
jgi:hypothetical protein